MSNSGPSASQVADEVRRKALAARLRVENPKRYEEYQSAYWFETGFSSVAIFIIFGGILISAQNGFETFAPIIFSVVIAVVILIFVRNASNPNCNQILADFETNLILRENTAQREVTEVKKISEDSFRSRGISIVAHKSSTVVVGSKVISSFNNLQETDSELSNAIATLVGYVEEQNNSLAAEALEDLVVEIDGERKPSKIRASWDYLVKILPDVAKLGAAAASISKLF